MRCSNWILVLPVLVTLSACASGPDVVFQDRIVEKPVPVVQPIDARLTADCVPATSVPADGALTLRAVLERLEAVEFALDLCRNDKAELRKTQ